MDAVVKRIESIVNSKVDSPHCLIELSTSEVKTMERNMIIVGGLSFMKETKKGPMISTYDDTNVDKSVHLTERSSIINGTTMTRGGTFV